MKLKILAAAVLVMGGYAIGRASQPAPSHVYELRMYTAAEGKFDALNARFRDHTCKLFEKHGMTNIGYWTPQDAPLAGHTLIYIIAHESREAAKKNWDAFNNDPEWKQVKAASEANGPVVTKVESVFVDATDYSPLK